MHDPRPEKQEEGQSGNFSPFVAFCFTINYILGTGFLTIPWAYVQGGLLLSSVVTLMVGLFSDMAKNFLLETMARAEVMLDDQLNWKDSCDTDDCHGDNEDSERDPLVEIGSSAANYATIHSTAITSLQSAAAGATTINTNSSNDHPLLVKDRKFEVNTLCRLYLGNIGQHLYTTSVCLYIYCALWAFTSVFASAMSKALPLHAVWQYLNSGSNAGNMSDENDHDNDDYFVYAMIYALMVVPLTCLELQEQVLIQVLLTGARFLLLALMLMTSPYCSSIAADAAAASIDDWNNNDDTTTAAPLIRLSGIDKMLPIMVFAHIFQHGVPDLSQPVANKKQLSPIFRSACMFTSLSYLTIGLTIGSAFQDMDGTGVQQSSNLNWDACKSVQDNLVIRVISYYIVCFPALDVISAFPLNAITLGNNMFGAFYGEYLYKVENNRWIRTRFRLLASIPPIVFAIFERELGKITDYAGTTGFVMGYSFPALLYIQSRAMAQKRGFPIHTYYASYACSYPMATFVCVFGLSMVGYVLYCLILTKNSAS